MKSIKAFQEVKSEEALREQYLKTLSNLSKNQMAHLGAYRRAFLLKRNEFIGQASNPDPLTFKSNKIAEKPKKRVNRIRLKVKEIKPIQGASYTWIGLLVFWIVYKLIQHFISR